MITTSRILTTALLIGAATSHLFAQGQPPPQTLALQQCIDLALKQNPAVLKAQQEIRRTHGLVVEARADTIPHVTAFGTYAQIDPSAIDKFPFGGGGGTTTSQVFDNQKQPWVARVEATQLLYAGGRVTANMRAAKLSDQIATLGFQQTVADTILSVRTAFYQILLNKAQVTVREQSVTLLEQQLEDARHRFDAGAVPRFNVLRAEVELANAKPPLIRAQNDLRLAREALVKLLAIDSPKNQDFTPIAFEGELAYEHREWNLNRALTDALVRRPELQQAEKQVSVATENIKVARAGYLPELFVFGNYAIFDSTFSDDIGETVDGWTVGARATWPLFDGLATKGKVSQARAQREQADLDFADARRAIELEVRQAYSDYLQSVELLEAQKKTVEQAEESLRLAEARFRAGTGTQLDVLSAQTALTDARSNEIQALYDYNVAVATLERATGSTVEIAP